MNHGVNLSVFKQVRVVLCGCRNEGVCVVPSASESDVINQADLPRFTCDCPPRFTGTLCEVSTDGCVSNPCVNGNCVEVNAEFSCQCHEGFIGKQSNLSLNLDRFCFYWSNFLIV